ncbi:hypothetical protein ATCV1_z314L [Acanthocystis turfacea chlorella virus 1]|uniref:Uncharacterized protein z314L n=1 Tax=Chlorovirus heliozoae TaxID=322019 RepID=A7K8S4_9PHYC|nr:hypothetical protein ATCV1_z314L [Acanthocystis turfacea chlorella virus 1]ABT16448.1 hypothetical protein ATCV1_z314L [Acanthocystis turfacea chlorella virus 1]
MFRVYRGPPEDEVWDPVLETGLVHLAPGPYSLDCGVKKHLVCLVIYILLGQANLLGILSRQYCHICLYAGNFLWIKTSI